MAIDVRSRLGIGDDAMTEFCRKWKITEVALFGSALRDDFAPESDIDLLVKFAPDAPWGLFDLIHAEDELKQLLGRDVDLIDRQAVEKSPNWIRRKHILGRRVSFSPNDQEIVADIISAARQVVAFTEDIDEEAF
jgi:predicted nucleotidyltransferase